MSECSTSLFPTGAKNKTGALRYSCKGRIGCDDGLRRPHALRQSHAPPPLADAARQTNDRPPANRRPPYRRKRNVHMVASGEPVNCLSPRLDRHFNPREWRQTPKMQRARTPRQTRPTPAPSGIGPDCRPPSRLQISSLTFFVTSRAQPSSLPNWRARSWRRGQQHFRPSSHLLRSPLICLLHFITMVMMMIMAANEVSIQTMVMLVLRIMEIILAMGMITIITTFIIITTITTIMAIIAIIILVAVTAIIIVIITSTSTSTSSPSSSSDWKPLEGHGRPMEALETPWNLLGKRLETLGTISGSASASHNAH